MKLEQLFLQCGLLQLGVFSENGESRPYRFKLELLPAYPKFFAQITDQFVSEIAELPFSPDRLVSTPDATALAGAISLKYPISIVYSHGCGESPVHDLSGAYNFGHPTCLITTTIRPELAEFVAGCGRVGLDIQGIIPIVGESGTIDEVPVTPLFSLNQLIHTLEQEQLIPQPQAESMRKYHS